MRTFITRSFTVTLLLTVATSSFAKPGDNDDAPAVDLVVTEVSTPNLVVPLETTFTVKSTVKNEGRSAASEETTLRFYLSSDSTITNAGIELDQTLTIPALEAGESSSEETLLTVPEDMLPGIYFIGVIVDGVNQQPETNETNNSNSPSTTTITVVFP